MPSATLPLSTLCHLFLLQRLPEETPKSGEQWPFVEYEVYLWLDGFLSLTAES